MQAFYIEHIQDLKKGIEFLEIKNSDNSCYANIDLMLGGSLQELKIDNKSIISNKDAASYHSTFMSSILFPFSNRIRDGKYHFNDKYFELDKSKVDVHNALHGLVYDKMFRVIAQSTTSKIGEVVVCYEEHQPASGYPFKYSISLHYILKQNSLELKVEIKNNDIHEFPFSLGWHPYFNTSDLFNSNLKINCMRKILVNDKMIPNGEADMDWNGDLKIEDRTFDDCFIICDNRVEFKTPEYHVEFVFSEGNNYLQLYTPNSRTSIAIEPQTAPADSFNNKIGLQTLRPNEIYGLSWKIKLI